MRLAIAVAVVLAWVATPAFAHRLDEYLQDATFSLGRDRVAVQMRLTPGVDVLRTVLGTIDTDGDGIISEPEQRAYVKWVLRELSLSVDGRPLELRVHAATFPKVEDMREGQGEILVEFDADVPAGGPDRRLVFENRHHRGISAYLVNCLLPDDPAVRIKSQSRSYDQSFYQVEYVGAGGRSSAPRATLPLWLAADALVLVAVLGTFLRRRRTTGSSHAGGGFPEGIREPGR